MSEREAFASLNPLYAPENQDASPAARRLQTASELLFLLVAFYAGLSARSFWVVLALGLISTVAYAAQHWGLWRDTSKVGSRAVVFRGVFGTLAVQILLIAAVYFAGLGVWTLINNSGAILAFGGADLIGAGVLLGFAIASGFFVGWLDRRTVEATLSEGDERVET